MNVAHEIRWLGAAPIWPSRALRPAAIVAPDLLRFESDDFMEELARVLQKEPATLSQRLATPRSYGARVSGAPAEQQPPPSELRLYQPVHGHFNLVAATLVCHLPGLPDHAVDSARERVGFVVRRLHPQGGELAWTKAAGKDASWQRILGATQVLASDEDLLPLFQVSYPDGERRRRLWAGLIPTSSLDMFRAGVDLAGAPDPSDGAPLPVPDPGSRDLDFLEARARVLDGLAMLRAVYPEPVRADASSLYGEREKEASRFLLVDLADVLERHVPAVWQGVLASSSPAASLPKARELYDLIDIDLGDVGSLLRLLRMARAEWQRITGDDTAPSSLDVNLRGISLLPGVVAQRLDAAHAEALGGALRVQAAAVPATSALAPPESSGPLIGRFEGSDARYVLRCVYQRPNCRPPHPDIVSQPSPEFALAPFFDPEAPARPLRIALPVDTSLKGLRKFRKNVGFSISAQLRKQMGQATDLKGLIDGKAGSEEPFSIGEICSFSLPIITLCAFIVLMIFMILLNFVFWWLPLLRFCFPIPVKR